MRKGLLETKEIKKERDCLRECCSCAAKRFPNGNFGSTL